MQPVIIYQHPSTLGLPVLTNFSKLSHDLRHFEFEESHVASNLPLPSVYSPYSKNSAAFATRNFREKEKRIKRCGIICIKYIFNVAHVLIVRGKRSHIWSLPKGCINEGESEIACAIRETLEESGLFVDLTPHNPRVCINHNVYFIAIINSHPKLKIRDKGEIDKVHWMTLHEMTQIECNKDLRSILQHPVRRFNFHNVLEQYLNFNNLPIPSTSQPMQLTTNSSLHEVVNETTLPVTSILKVKDWRENDQQDTSLPSLINDLTTNNLHPSTMLRSISLAT